MSSKYEDIIDLPHPTSKKHPRMPAADRAAQFSPFAALTGYEGAVQETARLTESRIELNEDELALLDERLQMALAWEGEPPQVSITYFQPDEKKDGGAYVTVTGQIRKVDDFHRVLVLESGQRIPMGDVAEIDGEIFNVLD